jgi:GNAT superfamily N-acetyltransferase
MKIEVVNYNSPHLTAVKKLGKENAATLGFLPDGAFDERALKGQILVALDEKGNCLGYLLYRIANSQAKIVHLCVGKDSRSSGIGIELIDYLKAVTKDLTGISLKCRRDYVEATKLWSKCSFVPLSESAGRGKVPSTLVYWWFDHCNPTLFDRQ